MKRLTLFLTAWLLLSCTAGVLPVSAQLFGSDEKNWEKVLVELKKINARLVTLHTRDLPTLHGNQADLKDQVDNIRGMFPGLQGRLEESSTHQDQRLAQMEARVAQIESLVRSELVRQGEKQQGELQGFKKDMADKFEQLKVGLAKDMETFASSNQQQFLGLRDQNEKTLAAMKLQLDKQADLTGQVVDHLTKILDSSGRQFQEVSRRLDALEQTMTANQKILAAGFAAIEANNKVFNANTGTITEVLKKGFTEQEKIRLKVEGLDAALAKTQAETETTRKAIGTLKDILDPKLDQLVHGQAGLEARTGEAQKILTAGQKQVFDQLTSGQAQRTQMDEKFGKLVDTTQAMLTHSGRVSEQVTQLGGKLETTQGEVNLANQKMAKLIDILKVMATDQQKLGQSLQGGADLQKNLEDLRERLEDLRRKANVSIARNDDILNLLKTEQKPAAGKAPNKG